MDKRYRILLVEDEATTVRIISESLKDDYDIDTAQTGDEAINQCQKHKPDLILMDVIMPGMNGYQACSTIKQNNELADIPVIFLTVADAPESEMKGLQSGGIDYLTKPVNLILLKLRVSNHLELKRKNDLLKQQRDLLEKQKAELEAALERIKCLEGTIPICMYCKNIRNDDNSWERLEEYIESHSDARFSHGICDACKKIHFPR